MYNTNSLYPLKFSPIFKNYIWGGNKLKTVLNKNYTTKTCAECWELSGVAGNISVVSNGFLAKNNLQELIEIYMGDLVGDKVYEQYGIEFPILIKFIDAKQKLSIQVHPDDEMAGKRHNAYGKTEMWYLMEVGADSDIIVGFNKKTNKEEYMEALNNKKIKDILNIERALPADVFFIPAGRIHAIGKDILLAEIQQTSDVTYRIYDWDRVDINGKSRELHTELAVDAIDYSFHKEYKTPYQRTDHGSTQLANCKHFTTNLVSLSRTMEKNYDDLDSFVVYICTSGSLNITWGNDSQYITVENGETILLPATLKHLCLLPKGPAELLEVYIS